MEKYLVTDMKGGGFRSECYQPKCGWYADSPRRHVVVQMMWDHARKKHSSKAVAR